MKEGPLKILVVDDDFLDRKMLAEFLKDISICDFAVNGQEAILAMQAASSSENRYDLILIDYEMPELNGMEFVKKIRDDETKSGTLFGKGIPIIMITAHREIFMKAFRYGVNDYILKPISIHDVLGKIAAL